MHPNINITSPFRIVLLDGLHMSYDPYEQLACEEREGCGRSLHENRTQSTYGQTNTQWIDRRSSVVLGIWRYMDDTNSFSQTYSTHIFVDTIPSE